MRAVLRRAVRAGARQVRVRREQVLLHRGERGHRLERRPRRIQARDRAVRATACSSRRPYSASAPRGRAPAPSRGRRTRTGRTSARTPSRGSSRRSDRARRSHRRARTTACSPARDGCRTAAPSPSPAAASVDRETDVVALLRDGRRHETAARTPERVDVHARAAGDAAEIAVVRRLHAGLPDLIAGAVALLGQARQLGRRDLADVAEDLRGERVVRVVADERPPRRHARELRTRARTGSRPSSRSRTGAR